MSLKKNSSPQKKTYKRMNTLILDLLNTRKLQSKLQSKDLFCQQSSIIQKKNYAMSPLSQFYAKNQQNNILIAAVVRKKQSLNQGNKRKKLTLSIDSNKNCQQSNKQNSFKQKLQNKPLLQKRMSKFAQNVQPYNAAVQNFPSSQQGKKSLRYSTETVQSFGSSKPNFQIKPLIQSSQRKGKNLVDPVNQLPFYVSKYDLRLSRNYKFTIQPMIDISILSNKDKTENSCQVQFEYQKPYNEFFNFKNQFHYNSQFLQKKIQQFKLKNQSDQIISKNYQDFYEKIQSQVKDERQQRAFVLGRDLKQSQNQMGQRFTKVQNRIKQIEELCVQNKLNFSNKHEQISECLNELSKIAFEKIDVSDPNEKTKFQTIHESIISLLKQSTSLRFAQIKYAQDSFHKIRHYIIKLQESFKNLKSHLYENRVLVYNCVKKIQQLPLLMFNLFGGQNQKQSTYTELSQEQKMKQFMSIKCQNCFHMIDKLSIIRIENQQMIPIFKSLQWLLKDPREKNIR